jgi:hypothetical protein
LAIKFDWLIASPTLTPPERTAGECLICGRGRDQHDMGTGLPTCRGITVPTYRPALRQPATDRESVRKEAFEEAAKVTEEYPTLDTWVPAISCIRGIATAIRALKDQPHDRTDMPEDDGLWDIRT